MQQPSDLRIWADKEEEDTNQVQFYMQNLRVGLLAHEFSN